MCFYDQHIFTCGDYKWGHFREHCTREYRRGETCGMKLIQATYGVGTKCKICEKIDTKLRRRFAEVERLKRWESEGKRFSASMEKARSTIFDLDREIYELQRERGVRAQRVGSGR